RTAGRSLSRPRGWLRAVASLALFCWSRSSVSPVLTKSDAAPGARHRRRVVHCGSSSQELRVARFGISENVPWIIPVRARCLVQLFEILAGELDGEGAKIVLELRLGPRADD